MPDEIELQAKLDQDERRQYERSRLIIDVFFDGHDLTGVASTKDIGAGGLYLNTNADVPENAVLLLRIPFGEKQVVVNGEVVYRNTGQGLGVRFSGLSAEDRELIENAQR